MPSLSDAGQQAVQQALDNATNPSADVRVPGLVFCAIDKEGKWITQQTSGHRGLNKSNLPSPSSSPGGSPMTLDSVFWIASCTKMITGLSALQLVEQGKLELDNHESLYKVLPELKDKMVLEENGKLVPKNKEITLRMLLSHTAGFGYTFFNPKLRDYIRPAGFDEFSGDAEDYMQMPLVNQPDTVWEYGINIDWAGFAVERASGMTLDEYFKKNVFEPLGIKNISFFPNDHMKENLVNCVRRMPDGSIVDIDHPLRRSVMIGEKGKGRLFQAGGAGCFAKPAEYCQILATLLNNGTSPTTGAKLLSPATVDMMFQNQIPKSPDFARQGIPAAKPEWTNPLPEMYPQEGNPPQGWGLTWFDMMTPGPTGRGANTAWWAGIINCFWWCDREKGVAGFIAGQLLPFGDPTVLGAWIGAEAAVYQNM